MEKVKLEELLTKCKEFLEEKITHEELIEWSKKIIIIPYLPIRVKVKNILYVFSNCFYKEDLLERFIELEMNRFWYIILAYTNIELDEDLLNEENYDIISSLCYNWIITNIYSDYNACLHIMDEIYNYSHHNELKSTFSKLSNTDFKELIDADNKMIDYLNSNPDLVKDLSNIILSTNSIK